MPFIDSKITVKLTDEKKESIKARLGEAISWRKVLMYP